MNKLVASDYEIFYAKIFYYRWIHVENEMYIDNECINMLISKTAECVSRLNCNRLRSKNRRAIFSITQLYTLRSALYACFLSNQCSHLCLELITM